MKTAKDTTRHPCFNKEAAGECGRVHLPVAPKCNVHCKYCNRKYDCVNESRPGVTSSVLSPEQAVKYMDEVLEREPRITVVGIAGPGDPMANSYETLTTMRLINEHYPHMLFCLSSNGLNLPEHVDELAELGVTHVTITMNAVDPEIVAKCYHFVRDGKIVYRGEQGAKLLLERQLEAINLLKEHDILVKINTIVIPGVNDEHIGEIAKTVGELGADIHNLMPLFPNQGTAFADVPEPSHEMMHMLRATAGMHLPQMTHCKRCRADAVGLLCHDKSKELAPTLQEISTMELSTAKSKPYVAVATREGMLVNLHLGEAGSFQIWEQTPEGYNMVDERLAPKPGCGPKRWDTLATLLQDCRAVLVQAFGEHPAKVLQAKGIMPHACQGFIETALDTVFNAGDMNALKGRSKGLAGACCKGGSGKGCV